jgi:hypothetical protein
MPLYEVRYKKRKHGGKKWVIIESNIQWALFKAYDIPNEKVEVEAIAEIPSEKGELKYALSTAFFNIMNCGMAGVDLTDNAWSELTNENLWVLQTLLTSIKEWVDKAETYLLAYERLID